MPIVCYTLEIRKHYLVSDHIISKVKESKRFEKNGKKAFRRKLILQHDR